MTIRERLAADLQQTMKARDSARLSCLRMLKSKMLEREVALRSKHGVDYQISDAEALAVIATYAKQRRESIEGFRQGGRDALVASEQAELVIVGEYLPQPLAPAELRALVREAIVESGAAGVSDLGAVMRIVMPKVQGAADGKQIQEIARELLLA